MITEYRVIKRWQKIERAVQQGRLALEDLQAALTTALEPYGLDVSGCTTLSEVWLNLGKLVVSKKRTSGEVYTVLHSIVEGKTVDSPVVLNQRNVTLEILFKSIGTLDLKPKTIDHLYQGRLRYVYELVQLSPEALARPPHSLGPTVVAQIRTALQRQGLTLGSLATESLRRQLWHERQRSDRHERAELGSRIRLLSVGQRLLLHLWAPEVCEELLDREEVYVPAPFLRHIEWEIRKTRERIGRKDQLSWQMLDEVRGVLDRIEQPQGQRYGNFMFQLLNRTVNSLWPEHAARPKRSRNQG